MSTKPAQQHGIKDNHTRGRVADFLSAKVSAGSKLSVVSAYFNGLVYELFFPEDLHTKNIHLFDACTATGISDSMDA